MLDNFFEEFMAMKSEWDREVSIAWMSLPVFAAVLGQKKRN